MADWENTPIRHRLDANQVNVVDTGQDAFVGADDAAYYDDVTANASELGVPDAPSSLALADDTGGQGTITWTDEGYNSDSYSLYYITGTVTNPETIIAGGTFVPSGNPAGTVITPGAGTWSVACAGINEFGTGPHSVVTDTIT